MKRYFVLILSFCFICFSCQKDTIDKSDEVQLEKVINSDIQVNFLSGNQLLKEKDLKASILKILEVNKSRNQKSFFDDNKFYIETENVKKIQFEGYHSYNFPLIKKDKSSNSITNLLLMSRGKEEGYDVYLVEYDFSSKELKNITKQELKNRKTKYKRIILDYKSILNSLVDNSKYMIYQCESSWSYTYSDDNGQLCNGCGGYSVTQTTTCSWVDSGGGGAAGGDEYIDDSPGSGSTSGGGVPSDDGYSDSEGCTGKRFGECDDVNEIINSPTEPTISYEESLFVGLLNGEEKDYYFSHESLRQDILSYLEREDNSRESKDFAFEGFMAEMNDGKVDFENEIIKDPSFIGTKAECVLDELINCGNNVLRQASEAFTDDNSQFKINFSAFTSDLHNDRPDRGEEATTALPNENGVIEIRFNLNQAATSSALSLVSTILHEMNHAELHRIIITGNEEPNSLPLDQYNFFKYLWNFYENNDENSENFVATQSEHYFMAKHLITPISAGIREFDGSIYNLKNYERWAWQGLKDYGLNKNYISQEEWNEIVELSNVVRNDQYESECD